jgi:hypothetical protein
MITIGDMLFLTPTPYTSRSYKVDEVYGHVIDHAKMMGLKVVDLRTRAYWNAYKTQKTFVRQVGEEESDIPITEAIPLFDAANMFLF